MKAADLFAIVIELVSSEKSPAAMDTDLEGIPVTVGDNSDYVDLLKGCTV